MQEVYPLFRDYSLAVKDWLRKATRLPRFEREKYDISKITLTGTANGGVNQHEIHLTTKVHNLKEGHSIVLTGTVANDEYYMVLKTFENIIILDQNYKKLSANQTTAGGKVNRTINVVYAGIEKAIATIAQPLRNGNIDTPGIGFYLAGHEQSKDKSRPKENYYTRRWEDASGNVVKTAAVPPLQQYQLHYSINLYSIYQQEMDIIIYQLVSDFAPQKWFWIGDPAYGLNYTGDRMDREHKGQWAQVELENVTDASDLETGSPNRTLRTEIGIVFTEAYLPLPFDDQQSFIGAIDIDMIPDLAKPIL